MQKIKCLNAQRPVETGRRYIDGLISTGKDSLHNIKNIFHQLEIFVRLFYSQQSDDSFVTAEVRICGQTKPQALRLQNSHSTGINLVIPPKMMALVKTWGGRARYQTLYQLLVLGITFSFESALLVAVIG